MHSSESSLAGALKFVGRQCHTTDGGGGGCYPHCGGVTADNPLSS
jgi:hypothetical protein